MTAQATFRAAMLDPAASVPAGLVDPQGRPAGRRFAVYRNNVAVSLTEALEAGFPVIRALVGDEFFAAMAGVFLRAHPPRSPILLVYGEDMPAFLQGFAPVAELPYLPDVARLELAIRTSYHAADAAPVAAERLATFDPEALLGARLRLAPAAQLIVSDWPVGSIWRANTEPGAPAPQMAPEAVLVTRPGFDPIPEVLAPGGGAFIDALAAGNTLGEAAETAPAGFDLATTLGLLLRSHAIVDIISEDIP